MVRHLERCEKCGHVFKDTEDIIDHYREEHNMEAEVERLKKENSLLEKAVKSLEAQSEKEQSDFITLCLEVERLKKENEALKSGYTYLKVLYDDGVAGGERRAMERVEQVLEERFDLWKPTSASENRAECITRSKEINEIYKKIFPKKEGYRDNDLDRVDADMQEVMRRLLDGFK